MPEDRSPRRAREIFEQTLEASSELERAELLERACGADAALRARVEALWKAHQAAESFLPDAPSDSSGWLECSEKPGERIGRYKLLEKIGEGGCGVVYLAEQEEPVRRKVALKVTKLGMDTVAVVARFEAERQALAMMDHPNIARVFDAGATAAGRPFFVMELVSGLRITQFCRDHALSMRERLDLFLKVCHAIQHAHQKGVIHRDIKPSNILVTLQDGAPVPKVIDFGIAKATEVRLTEKPVLTQFHALMGTPAYMSPEQVEFSKADVDTRTDIYSLGVLLYELLTGTTPFDAEALLQVGLDEWRRTIRELEPIRPSTRLSRTLGEEISNGETCARVGCGGRRAASHDGISRETLVHLLKGDLDWIVMKCLEKDRTRRYETAGALAQDILGYLKDQPVAARPPSRSYLLGKLVRRNRASFTALGLIFLTLIAGVAVSSWQAVRARKAERAERDLRERAQRNERAAREAREEARFRAYTSDMKSAASALRASNFGQSMDLLRRYFPEPGEPDLRGIEWRYLWQEARGDEVRSFPLSHFVTCVRFSPDGGMLAAASFDGEVRLIAVNSGKVIGTMAGLREKDATQSLAFAPQGTHLAACTPNGVVVRDPTGRETDRLLAGPCEAVIFSPDGRNMAVMDGKGVRWYRTSDWREQGVISTESAGTDPMAFDSTGQRLVLVRRAAGSVELWDVATCKRLLELARIEQPSAVTVSPDGHWLAVGNAAGELWLWDLPRQTLALRQKVHARWVFSLAFSPDGRTLASSGGDQVVLLWDTSTVEAPQLKRLATLKGHRSEIWSLAFSPQGSLLASGSKDATVKFWRAATVPQASVPLTVQGGTLALGFMPDATQFLMFSPMGELQLWDVPHARILRRVPIDPAGAIAFDPPFATFGRTNGTIETWTIPDGERVRHIPLTEGPVMVLGVSRDRRFCLAWDKALETATLWNLETRERLMTIPDFASSVAPGSWSKSQRTAFSPDNRWLAYAGSNYVVKLWDLERQQAGPSLRGHTWHIECLRFSADGSRLATGSWDAEARLWEAANGWTLRSTLKGHLTGIGSLSFSRDGRTLAVRSGDDLHFWSTLNAAEMFAIPNVTVWFFNLISPDGNAMIWEDGAFTGRFRVQYLPTLADIDREARLQRN